MHGQPPSSPPPNLPFSSPLPSPQGKKSNTDRINNNSRNGYCATWCLHMYLFNIKKEEDESAKLAAVGSYQE
ncbi:hypothetical protein Tco_1098795 [Tanacetum coccineum]